LPLVGYRRRVNPATRAFCVQVRTVLFFRALVNRLWYPKMFARPARAARGRIKRLVPWRQDNWVLPIPKIVVPPRQWVFFFICRPGFASRRRAEVPLPAAQCSIKSGSDPFSCSPSIANNQAVLVNSPLRLLLRRWRDQQKGNRIIRHIRAWNEYRLNHSINALIGTDCRRPCPQGRRAARQDDAHRNLALPCAPQSE